MSRYVGVIQFFFHIFQLLKIIFTQQNLCCINKPTMKHMQKLDQKLNLSYFNYDSRKCILVDVLTRYKAPRNCVHY